MRLPDYWLSLGYKPHGIAKGLEEGTAIKICIAGTTLPLPFSQCQI